MPAVSLYKVSAPIFVQHLTAMAGVLDKAAAVAEQRKLNQEDILNMRMYPDMFPFVRQIRQMTNHAVQAIANTSGATPPTLTDDEKSLGDLKNRINKAVEFIKSVKASDVDGKEDKEVVLKTPVGEQKMSGQALVLNRCLPNFYFHATTAYDILRAMGIELGKRDFMGTPPQM
jgi:hypothetical protein